MACRVVNFCPCTQALLRCPQKLSVGELSQQSPFLLIEQRIPQSRSVAWNSWLQYWLPLSL